MEDEEIINDGKESDYGKSAPDSNLNNNKILNETNNEDLQKNLRKKPLLIILRSLLIIISAILITLALLLFILYVVPALKELSPQKKSLITRHQELKKDPLYKKQIGLLAKDVQHLTLKFNAFTSGQSYIVINTIENKFYLYTNKKLVREGFCSSGSYTMLQTAGNKKWIFKTPKGKYWIHGKTTNPVWKRPDWSFVEEGSPIPPANDFSRYEYGVLGDYALALGDGYMIHGTIYKRFLGMPVTHGCVRLNDDDLKVIYNTLNIGSKVYIF
ncbi:MAG: L,D-transpeptidase [Bacteroidales bacterium]